MAHSSGHEEVSRYLIYCMEYGEILDPLLMELLDEAPPRPPILVL